MFLQNKTYNFLKAQEYFNIGGSALGKIIRKLGIEYSNSISGFHQSILNYLDELEIEYEINNKKIISPLELDIYIPEYNLAIECNGIYWHSIKFEKNDNLYHVNKTNLCEAKGIHLLQIFDFEWDNNKEEMKELILNSLNKVYLNLEIYDRRFYPTFAFENIKIQEPELHKFEVYEYYDCGYFKL